MKALGYALAILGVLALVYGGITYSRESAFLDVGPFRATATDRTNVPFSPVVGGVLLLAGILVLVVPRKRLA